jgi:hypothetical protein
MGTKSGEVSKPIPAKKRWHAVSVKPGMGACPVATSATQQRWLSREAPQLPLPGCTRPDTCCCTYQHHEDRRAGGRRIEDTDAFRRPVHTVTERRSHQERRKKSDE